MTNLIPLLNSTNRSHLSRESSKRKCVALVPKAAPTCTLSLTSVSVSAHGSSDSLNFIQFPSAPATVPFPSSPTTTPTSTSPTACSPTTPCPRPRVRTQASLLRRKRSSLRLNQLYSDPCSSPAESEPDQVASTPPRKRARKASISSPSISSSTHSTFHSLAVPLQFPKKGKYPRKTTADLRFLCTVYRSTLWSRLQRDISEAAKYAMKVSDLMDVDVVPQCASFLDAQELLLLSRLRSYLFFNEMSSQCLDVMLLPDSPLPPEVDMHMDVDIQESNSSSVLFPQLHPLNPTQLPIMTQEQITASLLFRYRQRTKARSRPEVPTAGAGGVLNQNRKRSPLAGQIVSSISDKP